jgi:hypothetical protein
MGGARGAGLLKTSDRGPAVAAWDSLAADRSPTVFQLKAMLYHAGILTERGAEPHRLAPTEDVWALRNPV